MYKNLRNKLQEAKGFTLTEMIVVLAIIGILTAIIAPNIVTLIQGASETADAATAKNILTAAQSYTTDAFTDKTLSYATPTNNMAKIVEANGSISEDDGLNTAWGEDFIGELLSTGTLGSDVAYIELDSNGIATGVVLTDSDSVVLATSGTGTYVDIVASALSTATANIKYSGGTGVVQ